MPVNAADDDTDVAPSFAARCTSAPQCPDRGRGSRQAAFMIWPRKV
jgi:hypothetical protein